MYETSVMKLKGGHVERGKIVQECNFENDAVKIALWYYTYTFPVFLLRWLLS